jgi:hypothetical protein
MGAGIGCREAKAELEKRNAYRRKGLDMSKKLKSLKKKAARTALNLVRSGLKAGRFLCPGDLQPITK